MCNSRRQGFSLVELLVVIAIVAILIAILLPAVQHVRVAARKTTCLNSLRQVSLAVLNYESVHQTLPSLSDRNTKVDIWRGSRGGGVSWRYSILPYLEEQPLYDRLYRHSMRVQTVEEVGHNGRLPAYSCPEEPNPTFVSTRLVAAIGEKSLLEGPSKTSYLDIEFVEFRSGEATLASSAWTSRRAQLGQQDAETEKERFVRPAKLRWVTDGLSKTILLRETRGGNMWVTVQGGISHVKVYSDWRPVNGPIRNGAVSSYHTNGGHVAMCDGSVNFLDEGATSQQVFAMATRSNGDVVSP